MKKFIQKIKGFFAKPNVKQSLPLSEVTTLERAAFVAGYKWFRDGTDTGKNYQFDEAARQYAMEGYNRYKESGNVA